MEHPDSLKAFTHIRQWWMSGIIPGLHNPDGTVALSLEKRTMLRDLCDAAEAHFKASGVIIPSSTAAPIYA